LAKKIFTRKTPEEKQKEIEELTAAMDEKINSYFESPQKMIEHLAFMSNFYQYSPRNMALIQNQFQGAEAVGSFEFWKSKGASVNKGEKGIKILVPTPVEYFERGEEWVQVKYATKSEKEQLKQGQLETEKKMFFSIGHVFEYTQTNAREKGLKVSEIFGRYHRDGTIENDKEMTTALKKIANQLGFEILKEPPYELGTTKGVAFPYEKKIALNPRNTDYENVSTLIHELAHAKLHTPGRREELTRSEREFQAEMVAYVVSNRYGIDTEKFSLSYLANWTQGKDINDKERLLKEVRESAKEYIDTIDNHFAEIGLLKENRQAQNKQLLLMEFGSLSHAELKQVSHEEIDKMLSKRIHELEKPEVINRDLKASISDMQLLLEKEEINQEYIQSFNAVLKHNYQLIEQENIQQPTILIQWSEHHELKDGTLIRFAEGNELMKKLELQAHIDVEREVEYYKTRYHLLIPNDNKVDLINMDRLDIGDGYYSSPYQQIISEKSLMLEHTNALLNDLALFKHQEKHGALKIGEPSMLIHGYMTDFNHFGKVNNADYDQIADKDIQYTVALQNEDKELIVFSGEFNKDRFAHPLHHMEHNGIDKGIYEQLEKHWHNEIVRIENEQISNWAKATIPKIHEAEKSVLKNGTNKAIEMGR
jgi:Large polyvalent protein associated domain 25/N-terminal domain of anti-restriction factor ArdC/IrrE N-terminal-like domain